MAMDLKTAASLAHRRYIAPTVVVLLLLSGGMTYVWSEYKELNKERKQLYDEAILSEKTRHETALALVEKKAELDKREFMLQQSKSENNEKIAAVQQKATQTETVLAQLRQSQSAIGMALRQKEMEDRIQRLMSEFSAMGVDLNATRRCNDFEAEARFNAAKAKYSEIRTLAEAAGVTEKYKSFFFHNGQNVWSACEN